MTTGDLITRILSYTDNVDATDADYTNRRAKILQFAQEVYDEVWNYRDWGFAQRNATVAVTATDMYGPLPSDFMDIGDVGGVYNSAGSQEKLDEVHPQELIRLRNHSSGNRPWVFSIFGEYTSGANKGRKQLHLPRISGDLSLSVWYQAVPATLMDATDSTNNLDLVPAQYHSTVLLAGVVYKTRKVKGEIQDWERRYKEGLAWMVTREKPRKGTVQRMPRAVALKW